VKASVTTSLVAMLKKNWSVLFLESFCIRRRFVSTRSNTYTKNQSLEET